MTRFAPSPTGYLHVGHVASALYVWGVGKRLGAQVLLRIEDHDRGRCRPEFERAILDDLQWLGFHPDDLRILRQSDESAYYEQSLAALAAKGLVYACDCSRKQIAAGMPAGGGELRYGGHCRTRGLALDAPDTGIRMVMPDRDVSFTDLALGPLRQNPAWQCGDLLLRDRQGNWTYQMAVVADDLRQGVTLVIRGQDLTESTARQIVLGEALGRAEPPRFYHHPLIKDESGQKLGKRFLSEAIAKRRAAGEAPEVVLGEAAHLVGLLPTARPVSAGDAVALFCGQGC